jgi:prophage tail gpP-like protein
MTFIDDIAAKALPSVYVEGRRLPDAVTFYVGNQRFDGWEEIAISRSMEQMTSSFNITVHDKWKENKEPWQLTPNKPINVKIGTENVITGYIDSVDVDISNDDRTMQISGRDKTCDLVDCSAIFGLSEFKNIKIETLAKKFADNFGIKVIVETDTGNAFDKVKIKQGETVFEMLSRLAKLRGLLLLSSTLGELIITNRAGGDFGAEPSVSGSGVSESKDIFGKPTRKNLKKNFDFTPPTNLEKSNVSLIQGENILTASATYDYTDRFQTYLVKGQSQGSDIFNKKNVTSVSAKSRDKGVNRTRPLLIVADGSVDQKTAQKRANWEANVRATRAVDVSVVVQGWQKTVGGEIWKPNELVRLESGYIGVESDMLVVAVTFKKTVNSGTLTTMKLTRPDAFNPDNDEVSIANDPTQSLGWASQTASSVAKSLEELFS